VAHPAFAFDDAGACACAARRQGQEKESSTAAEKI
jgi:hypothetical protein